MKRIIALLLVLCLSGALLAGCGESTSESSSENSSVQETDTKADTSDVVATDESETAEESIPSEIEEPSPSFVARTLKTVTETLPDGSVQSITEYDEQGNMTSYGEVMFTTRDRYNLENYNSKGEIVESIGYSLYEGGTWHKTDSHEIEYDENGNVTNVKYYYVGSSSGNLILQEEYIIFYDEHGNMTSDDRIDYDASGEFYAQYTFDNTSYTYDENGNIATKKTEDNFYEYSYNDAGLVDIEKEYNANIVLQSWTQYEYDSEGRVIKETVYGSDDTLEYTREYTYDQFGNLVKQVTIDSKGKETPEIERTYDYCNNITSEITYKSGKVDSEFTCEYTYDDAGNMTQKVLQDSDGKTIYTYENEYYD